MAPKKHLVRMGNSFCIAPNQNLHERSGAFGINIPEHTPFEPAVPSVPIMLADLFGIAGVIAGSSWAMFRHRRTILLVQGSATLFFALHYGLIGAVSGATMCAMTLLQTASALPERHTRWTTGLFWATVPMMIVLTALTWNGIASAGAAFGLTMATLGRWQSDTLRLRMFFVLCAMGWAVHNITVGSPFGLVSDTMCFATNLWHIVQARPWRKPAALPMITMGQPAV